MKTGEDMDMDAAQNIHRRSSQPKVPGPEDGRRSKAPTPSKGPTSQKSTGTPDSKGVAVDPDAIFKLGYLSDVYNENPVRTGGITKVITRFPPEPNGFLHLGHTKAIVINFGFASFYGGDCYLRFDDTNPSGEEEKFFAAIEENIRWLGFQPVRVTSSSDNFLRLYELAEELIKRGGAYVCHCTKAEVMNQRGGGKGNKPRYTCPHRTRPVLDSITEFRAMRDGKYQPQEAVLRMKQDLESGNPQLWDLAAYRVLDDEQQHHKTGGEWRIYPTYDFTHCLCDSFEGITHSLCTTEFELSRTSYEWLCDRINVYKPMQREFGRLNLSGTVLSKRKIIALIKNGHVHDWDDPRLYTLIALRRRGVPPGALIAFVHELGVTKATATIDVRRFEQVVRRYLETTVPRLMLVLNPVPVTIENLPEDFLEMVELPFSKDPTYGTHSVPFTRTVYIDRDDFRETASKDFFRLAPGSSVGLLKVPYPITATSFEKDLETGLVTSIHARYEKPAEGATFKKPKTYIHWIADSPAHNSPVKATVRVFNPLFNSGSPDTHPDGFLSAVNLDSEKLFSNAMIETGFEEIQRRAPWPKLEGENTAEAAGPEAVRFQGMRVAYFCIDKESGEGKLVLNRIVSLKEDSKKG